MSVREYALTSKTISATLRKTSHIVLGLDYDGTLTPIVKRPELARLDNQTRQLLKSLCHSHKLTLFVISGRTINDIRKLVGLRNIYYVGNHGFEIYQPGHGILRQYSPVIRQQARKLNRHLVRNLSHIHGVLIENKGITLSIHYRNTHRNLVPAVQKMAQQTKRFITPEWRLSYGKKVIEIKPSFKKINKGTTFKLVLREISNQNTLPVYIGDDKTDEDVFRVLRKKGISIYVGPRANKSCARFYLRDVSDVKRFLKRIMEETKNGRIS